MISVTCWGSRSGGAQIGPANLTIVTWPELTPPQLRVRTVEIDDPGRLLSLLPVEDAYAWVRHGDGLVAFGEAARHKPASIGEADEWFGDLVAGTEVVADLDHGPAGTGLVAFGSFLFDPERSAGQSALVVPETVIGRRHGRSWLTRIADRRARGVSPRKLTQPRGLGRCRRRPGHPSHPEGCGSDRAVWTR